MLGVCTLAATFSAGAQPTTGSIVGRLVDTSTGEPIVDGVLVLREFTTREQRVVHTDAAGEFRLVDLPAAAYSLHATALGYVGREYGQRHPMESGVPLELAVGENRADLVVPLPPSGTITGRVTTQDGQPLAYADVGALRPRIDGNRRLLVPMGRSQSNGTGEFRIAGLPPGHYYVAAIDPGDERTEDAAGGSQTAQTFFPGVSNAATAERVQLSFGGTRTDINFALVGAPTVTVRGQLVNPDGVELATASVTMSPESNDGLGLGVANAVLARPDGSFEFANVPPGDYRLRANGRTSQPGPALFGSFELVVRDSDVGNAVVYLNPGARLFGQVDIADGATTLAPRWTELWVSAPLADGEMGSGLTRSQLVEDGRFDLTTPEGHRVVRLEGLEAPWSLESVLYRGRNVIDIPFELQSGGEPERVRLVLTDQASRLTGTVHDQHGHPITDRAVIALPINPTFRHPGSRHVRLTYPDLSGRYDVSGLPAGVYLVAALSGIQEGDLYDASMFQEISAAGAEVVIETGAVSTFDGQITR